MAKSGRQTTIIAAGLLISCELTQPAAERRISIFRTYGTTNATTGETPLYVFEL